MRKLDHFFGAYPVKPADPTLYSDLKATYGGGAVGALLNAQARHISESRQALVLPYVLAGGTSVQGIGRTVPADTAFIHCYRIGFNRHQRSSLTQSNYACWGGYQDNQNVGAAPPNPAFGGGTRFLADSMLTYHIQSRTQAGTHSTVGTPSGDTFDLRPSNTMDIVIQKLDIGGGAWRLNVYGHCAGRTPIALDQPNMPRTTSNAAGLLFVELAGSITVDGDIWIQEISSLDGDIDPDTLPWR